jgi:hypothetical protein
VGYDAMELIFPGGEFPSSLWASTKKALDALKISFGPSHLEWISSNEQNIFIEGAPRLVGGVATPICRKTYGHSPMDKMVMAYTDPEKFLALPEIIESATQKAMLVFLTPKEKGILKSIRHMEKIKQLPSYFESDISAKMGQPLGRVAGRITLIHENPAQVFEDFNIIRKFVDDNMFVTNDDRTIVS